MFTVNGLGSGLDIAGIVEALVEAEKTTLYNLQAKETVYQAQLSGYGQLKSAVSDFSTAMSNLSSLDKFAVYNAQSGNESILTATTNSSASEGFYNIAINQLAQAHKVGSDSFAGQYTSLAVNGTIEISVDGQSFTVDIAADENEDTLEAIKNKINNASDNDLVKASIFNVNDGAGGSASHLVLTAKETGSKSTITVTDVSGNVASTLNITNEITAAQDAEIVIDGYTATRSSNVINDVLEGVTLNLKEVTSSDVKLSIDKNLESVTEAVEEFVSSYNELLGLMNSLEKQELQNDSSLRQMRSDLRKIISTPASGVGAYEYLFDVGINTKYSKDADSGFLELNTTKLTTALENDFNSVSKLFADAEQGIAARLEQLAKSFLDSESGIITIRTDGLNARISHIEERIEREEYYIEKVEARYLQEYTALDGLIAELNATTDYLTQQLGQISNVAGSKK